MLKKELTSTEKIESDVEDVVTEKIAKIVKKKVTTRKKASDLSIRQKIVWKIFDANYREVACFPYLEEKEAYLQADVFTKKKNKCFFVNKAKVPMD